MKPDDKLIKEIAEYLDAGLHCYFHRKTGEFVYLTDEEAELDWESEEETDEEYENEDSLKLVIKVMTDPDFRLIPKMMSHESFRIMENFISTLDDKALIQRLSQAISGRKPFANFKFQIDQSGDYRQQWFDFKSKQIEEWVRDQVEMMDE